MFAFNAAINVDTAVHAAWRVVVVGAMTTDAPRLAFLSGLSCVLETVPSSGSDHEMQKFPRQCGRRGTSFAVSNMSH